MDVAVATMAITTEQAAPPLGHPVRLRSDPRAVPRHDVDVLPRPRLWDRLDETLNCRAVLICASAGFGKTVLCASWLEKRPPIGRVAWVTLDADDREPGRFRASVHAALFGSRSRTESPGVEYPYDALPRQGLADLGSVADPVTLVLDDVHRIAGSPAVADLDFLIRHVPPACRVILLCRRAPALQLARLRLAGQLATIGPADLACTQLEAQQFLQMHGVVADSTELARLMEYTQGWIAGLRLLVLSVHGATTGQELVRDGIGEHELVTDYVRDEFLAGQPAENRAFLARTSLAETLTGELADMLSGFENGARILDNLRREHGFVQTVDSRTGTYSYHPMIRGVLRAELHREFPREIPMLQQAMGRWHRRYGRPMEALRCALAGPDNEAAYSLLACEDIVLFASNPTGDVEQLLDDLAADLDTEDPAVTTALAAARLRGHDGDAARVLLAQAAAAAAVTSAESVRLYQLKHEALRLAVAVQAGPLDPDLQVAAWCAADSARGRLGGISEHRARGWLLAVLGITHLAQGELPPARHALHLAERDLATVGPRPWWERVAGWLALVEAMDGRLTTASRLTEQVPTGSPVAGLIQAAQALVQVEQADYLRAERLLTRASPWQVECLLGEPSPESVLSAVRFRFYRAQSDLAHAQSALGQLRDAAGTYATALAPSIAVAEAAIAPGAGVDALLDAIDWPDDSPRAVWPVARDLVRAWGIVGSDPGTAIEIATDIAEHRSDLSRLLDRVSAMLVRAVAYRRLGREDIAARQLEAALALAALEDARQVFIDGGKTVRALLTVVLPQESRYAAFAAGILPRFDSSVGPRATGAPGSRGGDLTDSERAIMRYLSSHLTNEEIAADLCLSVNTVKTHLRSIYRKLGVRSRRSAIAVAGARELL